MTHQEILTKAIEKAALAGWELPGLKMLPHDDYRVEIDEEVNARSGTFEEYGEFVLRIDGSINPMHINQILFDKGFAKALWGEDEHPSKELRMWKKDIPDLELPKAKKGWQYHLKQMVIANDPIQYLEENI